MIDYTAVASRTFRINEARIVFSGKCKTNALLLYAQPRCAGD